MAMPRSLLVPCRGSGMVLRHAPAFVIAKRQIALASRIALVGRAAQPDDRLVRIARDTTTLQERRPHVALRPRHAALCERRPEIHRHAVLACAPGSERAGHLLLAGR